MVCDCNTPVAQCWGVGQRQEDCWSFLANRLGAGLVTNYLSGTSDTSLWLLHTHTGAHTHVHTQRELVFSSSFPIEPCPAPLRELFDSFLKLYSRDFSCVVYHIFRTEPA